jgi:hypothetical protein
VGVEVGVCKGIYSDQILKSWKGQKLYSIDPWKSFPKHEYVDMSNVSQIQQDKNYEETIRRLKKYGDRSEIIRETSTEATSRFNSRQLDFGYLDARHDYDFFTQDLSSWFPKIKSGGVFAGHDYMMMVGPRNRIEVKKAVDDFFQRLNIEVFSLAEDPVAYPSWYVLKP